MGDYCLTSIGAIFQLYHCENKLQFDKELEVGSQLTIDKESEVG
jgi:urease beta subunit